MRKKLKIKNATVVPKIEYKEPKEQHLLNVTRSYEMSEDELDLILKE